MPPIGLDEVKHVAKLARLDLTSEELQHYTGQLERILSYVEKLKSVTVDPGKTAESFSASTPERPDQVEKQEILEEVMTQAPKKLGTAFQVPKILE